MWRELHRRARLAGIPPGTRITASLARRLLEPAAVTDLPAPRNAYEAADRLAAEGHHVDVVAEGALTCHTGHCARTAEEPTK